MVAYPQALPTDMEVFSDKPQQKPEARRLAVVCVVCERSPSGGVFQLQVFYSRCWSTFSFRESASLTQTQ